MDGTGTANPVPGAVLVALAATGPVGIDARWQVSQAVPDGMCAFGPAGETAGITTIALIPMKLPEFTEGP